MRGSPLIRALIAFLFILSLGGPIWRLTREEVPSAAAAQPPAPSPSAKSTIRLQLSFTSVPKSVKVRHLGNEVWGSSTPTAEVDQQLQLEYPKEGIDLELEVEWEGNALAAMRVVVTDPDGEPHEKSVWGQGSVSEVLTFP